MNRMSRPLYLQIRADESLQLGEGAGNEGVIVLGCRLALSQAEGDIMVPLTC